MLLLEIGVVSVLRCQIIAVPPISILSTGRTVIGMVINYTSAIVIVMIPPQTYIIVNAVGNHFSNLLEAPYT